MAIADEIYPYSTQNGIPIPLEIIKPLGVVTGAFTSGFSALTLPASCALCSILASEDMIIDFTNSMTTVVAGTFYTNVLYAPKGIIVIASIPTGTVKIKGLTLGGSFVIQALQKWSALSLPRQLGVKTS